MTKTEKALCLDALKFYALHFRKLADRATCQPDDSWEIENRAHDRRADAINTSRLKLAREWVR